MNKEEKEAIKNIKKDDEYYDILENIKLNKYNMLNVEKLMQDTITGDYTEYEIAQSIIYLLNLIEKQQKEIEELKNIETYKLAIIDKDKYISKDKIRELQDKYKKEIEKLESKKLWNEPVDTIKKNRYTNYYNAYEELLKEE